MALQQSDNYYRKGLVTLVIGVVDGVEGYGTVSPAERCPNANLVVT